MDGLAVTGDDGTERCIDGGDGKGGGEGFDGGGDAMSALTWVGIVVGVVLFVGFLVVAFSDWGPEVPDWLRDLFAALRWRSGF